MSRFKHKSKLRGEDFSKALILSFKKWADRLLRDPKRLPKASKNL
jgi:hypothetical protein